jgi:putative cardiolipin synthase
MALAQPEETRVGAHFAALARQHAGNSAFRILSVGVDGFVTRVEMIDAAERTLDLQYYIFRGDETGRLITQALMRAADRGVRVRILVDDGDTVEGDEQITTLATHAAVEVRVFNPFSYRGHRRLMRNTEFVFNKSRLDYRMHNKLIVADNTIALVGGRNVGNQYFQLDPESQFADDDVFAAGPIAVQLSATFDEYWNSALAIPAQALGMVQPVAAVSASSGERRKARRALKALQPDRGIDYLQRVGTGEPYAGMLAGRLPLVWAHAEVICDSPEKKEVVNGALPGRLMSNTVLQAERAVQRELILVTPYFVPSDDEMTVLRELGHHARVRVLTNSLEAAPDSLSQSGYRHYRVPALQAGAEIHEVRSLLGNQSGSGQTAAVSRFGTYALHAKLLVFDRQRVYIGSMNYDQRSRRLNTEVGVIIDSPELAQQTAARFEAMTQLENSYEVTLSDKSGGHPPSLVWRTVDRTQPVETTTEPAHNAWEREKVRLLSLLPIKKEL